MKKLVIANWKMNFDLRSSQEVFTNILRYTGEVKSEMVICPSFVFLHLLKRYLGRARKIKLGAQNVFYEEKGAFTGEISASMLEGLVDYVLVGHSERRENFLEDDETVAKKIKIALDHKIKAVLCIGESEEARRGEKTLEVLKRQINKGLKKVKKGDVGKIVIAYEPVWAISTSTKSIAATEEQIVEAKLIIKKYLVRMFGRENGEKIKILYGGSVNRENVCEYVGEGKMDGVLIGSASLDPDNFIKIVKLIDKVK